MQGRRFRALTMRLRLQYGALAGLVTMDAVMTTAAQFLTAAEQERMEAALHVFLSHYYQLASQALTAGVKLWKVVPKFHMLEHMVLDQAPFQNPRSYHGYSDEAGLWSSLRPIALARGNDPASLSACTRALAPASVAAASACFRRTSWAS